MAQIGNLLPARLRSAPVVPDGPKPARFTFSRLMIYAALIALATFFVVPIYVMIATSLKPMSEIREGAMLALPQAPSFAAWIQAWSTQCTGFQCEGLRPGFWNSVQIVIPSVLFCVAAGALTGYVLSFWKFRSADFVFAGLILAKFIPTQVFILPLVVTASTLGIYGTLWAVVIMHVVFELAIISLLFRNYFVSLPIELISAARVDGAGFFRIFFSIVLPMSLPIIIVSLILLTTSIWNDYLLGLVFAGQTNHPMTVQLSNMINSEQGIRNYSVEMAAVFITTLLPLVVYAFSGRWFVRGIASGAVKG